MFYVQWFTSAPMCDVFLTLAKTKDHPNSPSCFLVPRWLPDGTRNEGSHQSSNHLMLFIKVPYLPMLSYSDFRILVVVVHRIQSNEVKG